MYEQGHGVPQDYAEAVKWYRLAAEQGNAEGQIALGNLYVDGSGVPTDYVLAPCGSTWQGRSATRYLGCSAMRLRRG
jgi:TPR repeat protein